MRVTALDPRSHPSWSADGTRVAYSDANDVYFVEVKNGRPGAPVPLKLGDYPLEPSWSADGRSLYFARFKTFRAGNSSNSLIDFAAITRPLLVVVYEVFRVPVAASSQPVAIEGVETEGGAFESTDGNFLLFRKDGSIWRVPVRGGTAERILNDSEADWGITKDGLYTYGRRSGTLTYFDLEGHKQDQLEVARDTEGMSVSRNGGVLVYSVVDRSGSDIAVLRNIRRRIERDNSKSK
jgi:dipeptidyl aminopeptidase/acylaminoacyl peptidase